MLVFAVDEIKRKTDSEHERDTCGFPLAKQRRGTKANVGTSKQCSTDTLHETKYAPQKDPSKHSKVAEGTLREIR